MPLRARRRLVFQQPQEQRKLRHLDRLRVQINSVDVPRENILSLLEREAQRTVCILYDELGA